MMHCGHMTGKLQRPLVNGCFTSRIIKLSMLRPDYLLKGIFNLVVVLFFNYNPT